MLSRINNLLPDNPYTETRPWGTFIKFTENCTSTVKIITVKKGEALSLQYHNNRDEYWFIISGKGTATIGDKDGDKEINIEKGTNLYVSAKTRHRIKATEEDIVFLEISIGNFDEKDIVRIKDDYGRI